MSWPLLHPGRSVCYATLAATVGSGEDNAAAFTLLGVGITAGVSIIAVYIKSLLDGRAQERRYAQEVAMLRLRLEEERGEALRREVRTVNAAFLVGTAAIYGQIVGARRQRRGDRNDDTYRAALRSVDPHQSQVSLEESRMLSSAATVEAADQLWGHLRTHSVPSGLDLSSAAWDEWKNEHWRLRKELVLQLRAELVNSFEQRERTTDEDVDAPSPRSSRGASHSSEMGT